MAATLKDRIALITGAARGMGEATARLFAEEGACVVIADVDRLEGEAVAKSIGSRAVFEQLDVTSQPDWEAAVARAAGTWGGVDILVNNAGMGLPSSVIGLEKAQFMRVLEVNLVGAWLGIRAVAPGMISRKRGAIVNVSSSSGLLGLSGLVAYSSSKWGMRGLSKTAALELGPHGIRVNTVFPGGVNTRMGNVTNGPVEELNAYYAGQPIKRIGEPHEIAKVNLFLASDASSYLCGAEVAADGGMSAGIFNDFLPHA